jgi:phosphopantetheinyl transferase
MNTAMALGEAIVHTMNPVHGMGPVFYAYLACASRSAESPNELVAKREVIKRRLISSLWDHFSTLEHSRLNLTQSSNRADCPIQVLRGPGGRPQLLMGDSPGPSISFSNGEGKVWAALCGDESDIGIDVADADEFQREYPFHRAFHQEEFQYALKLTGDDFREAAAMLWSVKEAVVKALGCAFHLVDPRQITIYPSEEVSAGGNAGYNFAVDLSGKALERFPIVVGQSLWARSLPQEKMWLSIALLNRRPTDHE